MKHCVKFNTEKTIYLYADRDNVITYIQIGHCPRCNKTVIEVYENCNKTRLTGVEADKYLLSIKHQIEYTVNSNKPNKPVGWVYGYNKELKDGTIKQYSMDFRGNKEQIKEILPHIN